MSDHLSFIIFLPIFFISLFAQSDKPLYPNCPSSSMCGDLNISYPFWRIEGDPPTQLCGYEGFGIRCFEDRGQYIAEITLGRDPYFVRAIDYTYGAIYLKDPVARSPAPAPGNCPRLVRNITTLGTSLFEFTTDRVNLSFRSDCNGCPGFATELPCLELNERKACLDIMNTTREESEWDAFSCGQEVVTSVSKEFIDTFSDLPRNFSRVLEKGFVLRWEHSDKCEKCQESSGLCGLQNTRDFLCFCPGGTTSRDDCKGTTENFILKLVIGFASTLVAVVLVFIIYYILKPSSRNCITSLKPKTDEDKNIEAFVMHYGSLSTKRYTYNDIKKMTNSFKVKLGHGGFGQVFKGKLLDGRLVAVKVLNSSKANGQEFINEVASIGRTAHVNIVALLGFCSDNNKRALVYEYMPNGSLEKFINSNLHMETNEHIGVKVLYEIALGIASGLDYLHRGCSTRILHLDIKPHNILLDEDFCPKIADFGLAKLYSRKESIVSMLEARGTIGYIAPEVYNKNFGGVSHKSDVYSYGMLLLEMVGGRKNVDAGIGSGRTSEIYFPDWIYKRLHKEDFLLDSITNAEENDYARKMTIIGLWCIQPAPNQRPSINEVIEMLEGSMEVLKVPPKPFFSSPPRSPATIYSTSGSMLETT